ncbi:MAG: TIGR01212 family radical SAM protein [Acholeplasmataceae bacterium]|jgi:radical SAM protein (TIGR01212 family)
MLITSEKHYNTLNNYYMSKYGKKVFKVSLNAGFSCPNIDGTVGRGGCSFCSTMGSGEFAGNKRDPLKKQFEDVKTMMHQKWPEAYYIPYFQANTNTHAPVSRLKELFEEAITLDPLIVEISIATRPDALPDDVINYLSELNTRIPVQVELGLQTIHDDIAKDLNRLTNVHTFDDAVKRLRKENIEVVVHIINGLPDETKEMMLDTIRHINTLDIQGIKIHMLNILSNSKMGQEYLKKPFQLLSRKEYIDIVVNQIRLLRKDIIIHRLTGDGSLEFLIEPKWIIRKFTVLNDIDKILRKNNWYQGDLYEKE